MSVAKPLFTTPDYSVQYDSTTKGLKNSYSDESLKRTHEKFVKFREGLRQLEFLPVDGVETDEVSFQQEQPKTRTIFFRFKAYREFVLETASYLYSYGNNKVGQIPDMYLFSAHLQKPETFGYSPQNSKLYSEAFTRAGISHVLVQREGLPYADTLRLLTSLKEVASEKLSEQGITPTPERVLRFWAVRRFIELGKSVIPSRTREVADVEAKVYELVEADLDLYLTFLGVSRDANPDYQTTGKFSYSVDALKELNGVPHSYLSYMFSSASSD